MKMSGRHSKRTIRRTMSVASLGAALLVTLVIAAGALLLFVSDGNPLIVGVSLFMFAIGGLLIWLSPGAGDDYSLEHRTGLVLDGLADAGFAALHDLQLGDRRLDYVLIGPPGLFVVRVDPRSDRAVRKRSDEGAVAETLRALNEDVTSLGPAIDPQVKPLLVTARKVEVDVPDNGKLIAVTHLENFLRTQPSRLDPSMIGDCLADVLRAATAKSAIGDDDSEEGVSSA